MELPEGHLLALGSPLLDITATADEDFLRKYDLNADDAVRAGEKHKHLIKDMVENYQPVTYTSGGSTGNTVRIFQWLVGKPRVSAFTGCIAKDSFGQILEDRAREAGVDLKFQYHPTLATGTCAVIVTGHYRSLVADLAASSHFSLEELLQEHRVLVQQAEVFYAEGFFLTVSLKSLLHLAQDCTEKGKTFCMNLSAPFLCRDHADKIAILLPYTNVLFGNREEATALVQALCHSKTVQDVLDDPKQMALWIASYDQADSKRDRLVVLTQGKDAVLLATQKGVTMYPVTALDPDQVVDTNGAGDAFVGGFLSQMVQVKPEEVCVRCGIYAAQEVIQRFGCTFPADHSFSQS